MSTPLVTLNKEIVLTPEPSKFRSMDTFSTTIDMMVKMTVDENTKLIPRSANRTEVNCVYMRTEGKLTTIYWLYKTKMTESHVDEAEIIGQQTNDWSALSGFVAEIIAAAKAREPK